jgi:hypothetical protein
MLRTASRIVQLGDKQRDATDGSCPSHCSMVLRAGRRLIDSFKNESLTGSTGENACLKRARQVATTSVPGSDAFPFIERRDQWHRQRLTLSQIPSRHLHNSFTNLCNTPSGH